MQNQNEEIEIHHRITIEEEDIEISDLPSEIRTSMREFNKKLKQYEDSGDVELFYELQQDDIAIGNNIQTFIEDNESDDDDYDEEDEDDLEEEKERVAQAQANAQARENAQAQANAKAQADAATKLANTPKSAEEKVLAKINNNIISVSDLEEALGSEPQYPIQKVGNIKLKKQYLKPFYEVV